MIYAGFEFAPVPNWDVIMPIKAPSNYKKPEAIEKYIAERKVALASGGAAVDILTGTVRRIFVVDPDEHRSEMLEGDAVCGFFKEALDAIVKGSGVVGYRIHRAMHILAITSALHADSLGEGNSIPVSRFKWIDELYNRYRGFVDPVSLLFGTTDIDLNAVAMRCGVKINPESPESLAEFAQVMLRNVDLGSE